MVENLKALHEQTRVSAMSTPSNNPTSTTFGPGIKCYYSNARNPREEA